MKLRKRTKIEFAVILVLLLLYAVLNWDAFVGVRSKVGTDKGHAVGMIVDYKLVGGVTHYLTYEYYANGERYENTVVPVYYFKDCYADRKCIGRRFTVYYSNSDARISYIDLHDEVVVGN